MELNAKYEKWFSSKNTFRYVIVATIIFFLFLFFKKRVYPEAPPRTAIAAVGKSPQVGTGT
jgi:hypothetical protein